MNLNPSYIFFRELEGDGPIGTEGVALTPGRSLAVDRAFLAMGLPVWLDADDPLEPTGRLRRLMVAQDTGGAIRGPVRGDVFFGQGPTPPTSRAMRARARPGCCCRRVRGAAAPGVSSERTGLAIAGRPRA